MNSQHCMFRMYNISTIMLWYLFILQGKYWQAKNNICSIVYENKYYLLAQSDLFAKFVLHANLNDFCSKINLSFCLGIRKNLLLCKLVHFTCHNFTSLATIFLVCSVYFWVYIQCSLVILKWSNKAKQC